MKVVLIRAFGGPEAMTVVEQATPAPKPGEALVRVEASGVNFIDVYHRTGRYPAPLPRALGLEGAGVVEEVGPGVTDVSRGDRVAWASVPGSYATHVIAPADRLVPLPASVDFRTGAAAMLQGMTAHYLTRSTFALGKGDSCLVHAAAGGVGLLLCQIAKLLGARALGTVSTGEKAELARAAGADATILYTRADFEAETRRLTSGRGVDVVYDSVGKDTFDKSLGCLRPRGTLVLFGQSSGNVPPLDPQVLNAKGSLFLTRPSLAHYTATREELLSRAGEVFGWIATGALRITIGAELALDRVADAHRDLEGRRTVGKVLLLPQP